MHVANNLRSYADKAGSHGTQAVEAAGKEAGEKVAGNPRQAGPAYKVELSGNEGE